LLNGWLALKLAHHADECAGGAAPDEIMRPPQQGHGCGQLRALPFSLNAA
jgi:hypothetical protein